MATKTDSPLRQDREHRVAVLLFQRPAMFELSVAIEVWGNDRTEQGVPYSQVRLCSNEGPRLRVETGFDLIVDHQLDALEWADTIVIPNGGRPSPTIEYDPAVLDALRAAYERGARLLSFCSGAFPLAATGLLDGRCATTHWTYMNQFRARHPSIELEPDVLYAGGDRLYTSAGTSAAIDLCLHLVREDWGAEVANTIARRMVVPPHRDGGQAQYIEQPIPTTIDVDADLRAVLQWVESNLERNHTVDDLARAGGDDAADLRSAVQGVDRDDTAAVDPASAGGGQPAAARGDHDVDRRDRRHGRLRLRCGDASALHQGRRLDPQRLPNHLPPRRLTSCLVRCCQVGGWYPIGYRCDRMTV